MSSAVYLTKNNIHPGVCRFCSNLKKCRIINETYYYMGRKEIYTDMIFNVFGITLSHMDIQPTDRLVCATCVVKLRAANAFKKQVLQCEEDFLKRIDLGNQQSESLKYEEIEYLDNLSSPCSSTGESQITEIKNEAQQRPKTPENIEIKEQSTFFKNEDSQCVKNNSSKNPPKRKLCTDDQINVKKIAVERKEKFEVIIAKDQVKEQSKEIKNEAQEIPKTPEIIEIKKQSIFVKNEDSQCVKINSSKNPPKRKLCTDNQINVKKIAVERKEKFEAIIAKDQAKEQSKERQQPLKYNLNGSNKEKLAKRNTITLVENSFVCPFNNITGNYYCYYCRAPYTDPDQLREHTMSHNPTTFGSLRKKKKAAKIDITRIDCRLCQTKIDDLTELKEHLKTAHNKTIYAVDNEFLKFKLTHPNIDCQECGKTFYFIDKLIAHMSEHFGRFVCDKCGAAFVQASSLEAHIRCHNKSDIKFPCHICGKHLSSNYNRNSHIATLHEKKPVVDCLKCDERFFNYDQRNKHLVEVHGDTRSYPCTMCDKQFDTRKKFVIHNMVIHKRNIKHKCSVCEKAFGNKSRLLKHFKTHKL